MHRISDIHKLDVAIAPASINGASTGFYYSMSKQRKSLFICMIGVMAAARTAAFQVMQATDALGTGAKVVTGATATITANTLAAELILTASSVHVAGQTVTINDLVFTAAAADVPTTREYAVGSSAADSSAALLAKINSENPDIGIPNVIGVATSATVNTLSADEPGDMAITAVASAATTVVATNRAIAYVEVDAAKLDVNDDFGFVAIRVTNSHALQTGVSLVRGNSRYTEPQHVAAFAN